MPLLKLKKAVKPAVQDIHAPGRLANEAKGLKASTLKIFDIPLKLLVEHKENPNEQSEKTFDQLVERIRKDGFDDPIKVVPQLIKGKPTGKYLIVGGHHRVKAAHTLSMETIPAIIREGWDQDRVDIELLADNTLGGQLNPYKFTELWDRLKKRYDPETLKQLSGLTEKKQFNALYKRVHDSLNPKQQAKLETAKETINSVEDLSSVLNEIFTQHGSEVDYSMMAFSYGGKQHHYVQVSKATHKKIGELKNRLAVADVDAGEYFAKLLDSPQAENVFTELSAKKHNAD